MIEKIKQIAIKTIACLKNSLKFKAVLKNERKTELVLNIAIYSFIIFILIFFLLILTRASFLPALLMINYLIILKHLSYFLFILLIILFLSYKKRIKTASFLLILFIFFLIIKFSLVWGIEIPPAIGFFIILITLSSILINPIFSFIIAFISEISIIILSILQTRGVIRPAFAWEGGCCNLVGVLILSLIFLLIALLSYSNKRELEKSLARARESEKNLKIERTRLDLKIKEKTDELKKAQLREFSKLRQLAEFGRFSAGLFHELANPLTALNLCMEQMSKECQQNEAWEKFGNNIERSTKAAKKMGIFLKGVKKQLSHREEKTKFSLNNEIEEVLEIIEFKAIKNKVNIVFNANKDFFLYNNSLKFHQIASNLISNAIDSYEKKSLKSDIIVCLEETPEKIILSVKDKGCGLTIEDVDKIFNPFFSTKDYNNGTGLGLTMVKSITEQDFRGTIVVKSIKDIGTEFIITFPVNI